MKSELYNFYNGIDIRKLPLLKPTREHVDSINQGLINYKENNVKEYLLHDYFVQGEHFCDVLVSYEVFSTITGARHTDFKTIITKADHYKNIIEQPSENMIADKNKGISYIELYKLFKQSTKENFPESECTMQDERDSEVYNSDKKYLCLIIDDRFKHDYRITLMTPYICKHDGKVEYGWVDCLFQQPHTNIENSVRLEHEIVVGFQEFLESDEANRLFEYYVQCVNN